VAVIITPGGERCRDRSTRPVWACPAPALAVDDAVDCETAESTKDPMICAKREYEQEIGRLNRAYQRLNALRPNDAAALKAAQRAYIRDRDLTCEWQAQIFYQDGTAEPLARLGCLTQMERARADHLEDILRYRDGL
jgi:uncharacterized protein YecT (DUF1311 family)